DLLYIPGGVGAGAASQNPTILDFVRAHHAEGRWIAANCAGLGVLYRAGLLTDPEVAAPATVSRRLANLGAHVANPRRPWVINAAQKLFTAAGAATVHPSTIALAWQLFCEDVARDMATTWDTLPLHGESLFSLEGPRLADDAEPVRKLQDTW